MIYWVMKHTIQLVLDILSVVRLTEEDKDIEILLLRQQLRIATRNQERGPNIPRWEKLTLAMLAHTLKQVSNAGRKKLTMSAMLFKPDTLLKWHRMMVRRKWTYQRKGKPGRPPTETELEVLVLRLKRENLDWGYGKLQGELKKLGYQIGERTIGDILARHGLLPAPESSNGSSSWRSFLNHYKDQIMACDFFTVETLMLKTLYVLFFIEHGTRRVHLAGCTEHPNSTWVTQQFRQLVWEIEDRDPQIKYLIRDNDKKFSKSFDSVFSSEDVEIIRTPFQAPKANAIAERWVRSVREECLDRLIILNERHLYRVLDEYINYYNEARPHQGIEQQTPIASDRSPYQGDIHCRDVLGGIIHDYYRQAA
jgi:putative transposase